MYDWSKFIKVNPEKKLGEDERVAVSLVLYTNDKLQPYGYHL